MRYVYRNRPSNGLYPETKLANFVILWISVSGLTTGCMDGNIQWQSLNLNSVLPSANKLLFSGIPSVYQSIPVSSNPLAFAPQVQLFDSAGKAVMQTVTVTLLAFTDSGCTVPLVLSNGGNNSVTNGIQTTQNGVATFANLPGYTKAGPVYFQASAPNFSSACSSTPITFTALPFDHLANFQGLNPTSLSLNPTLTTPVQTPLVLSVQTVDIYNNPTLPPASASQLTFTQLMGSAGLSTAANATPSSSLNTSLNTNGQASVYYSPASIPGAISISAQPVASGGASYPSLKLNVIVKAGPATQLTLSALPGNSEVAGSINAILTDNLQWVVLRAVDAQNNIVSQFPSAQDTITLIASSGTVYSPQDTHGATTPLTAASSITVPFIPTENGTKLIQIGIHSGTSVTLSARTAAGSNLSGTSQFIQVSSSNCSTDSSTQTQWTSGYDWALGSWSHGTPSYSLDALFNSGTSGCMITPLALSPYAKCLMINGGSLTEGSTLTAPLTLTGSEMIVSNAGNASFTSSAGLKLNPIGGTSAPQLISTMGSSSVTLGSLQMTNNGSLSLESSDQTGIISVSSITNGSTPTVVSVNTFVELLHPSSNPIYYSNGNLNSGSIVINSHGTLKLDDGTLNLGADTNSAASITVNAGGTLIVTDTLVIASKGSLIVNPGGIVQMGNNSSLRISGGKLILQGSTLAPAKLMLDPAATPSSSYAFTMTNSGGSIRAHRFYVNGISPAGLNLIQAPSSASLLFSQGTFENLSNNMSTAEVSLGAPLTTFVGVKFSGHLSNSSQIAIDTASATSPYFPVFDSTYEDLDVPSSGNAIKQAVYDLSGSSSQAQAVYNF